MVKADNIDEVFSEDMNIRDFIFDEKVASVFDDMLERSIPLYGQTQIMAMQLGKEFVQPDTNVFDIGCSTCTLLDTFASIVPDETVNFVGIDNSKPMLEQARKKLDDSVNKDRVSLKLRDIQADMGMDNASVVFMLYTLQFVRPLQREATVRQIYDALAENGCLILVEKVLGNDSLFNRLYIEFYYEYKRKRGYTDKEIQQKRESLENVMIPYRIDENIELLKRCGFGSIDIFFKWYNWTGMIAVKTPN